MLKAILNMLVKFNQPVEQKPYEGEHSCRLNPPDKYDRIRRQNSWRMHNGMRMDAIWGVKDNKTELQAIRMPMDDWDASTARSYCSELGGRFDEGK